MWGRVPTALARPISVTSPNVRLTHAPLTLSFQTNRLARLAPAAAVLTADNTTLLATVAHSRAPDSSSAGGGAPSTGPLVVDFRAKAAAVGLIPATWTRREAQPALSDVLTARLIDRSIRPILTANINAAPPTATSTPAPEAQLQGDDTRLAQVLDSEQQAAMRAPLFPPVHLTVSVLSSTLPSTAPLDALAVNAAAAALSIANPHVLPDPLAAARVAVVNGEYVPFPSDDVLARADLTAFAAVNSDARILATSIHTRRAPVTESDAVAALRSARDAAAALLPTMRSFREAVHALREEEGYSSFPPQHKNQATIQLPHKSPLSKPSEEEGDVQGAPEVVPLSDIYAAAYKRFEAAFVASRTAPGKAHRAAEMTAAYADLRAAYPDAPDAVLSRASRAAHRAVLRRDGIRMDGRRPDEVRPLRAESSFLSGDVHGSAVFERGDTQVLACGTIGLRNRARKIEEYADSMSARSGGSSNGESTPAADDFFVHYAFPPFATGEAGRYAGPINRREIGHSILTERALSPMLDRDQNDELPYALRVSADVLSSDGSSSMASVCAGSMALMDCGAPLREPVAGIAMGLIMDENANAGASTHEIDGNNEGVQPASDECDGSSEEEIILTDILGAEDHFGDMDMKVAGPSEGITACQMDTKKPQGLNIATIDRVLLQAKQGRQTILATMRENGLDAPGEMPESAPRIVEVPVTDMHIRMLLRDRAAMLRNVETQTGARLQVEDLRSIVRVDAANLSSANAASKMLREAFAEVEVGTKLRANVVDLSKTYARVEIAGSTVSGILHVSKMQLNSAGSKSQPGSYPDARRVFNVGDEIEVVVLEAGTSQGVMRVGLLAPPTQLAESKLGAEIDAVLSAKKSVSAAGKKS